MADDPFPYFPRRARHFNSPLAEARHRFLAHLVERGYAVTSVQTVAPYLLTISKSLRLDKRPGALIGHAEILTHAARWAHRKRRPKWSRQQDPHNTLVCFCRIATQWLQFLGRLQPNLPTPKPFAAEIAAFVAHLRLEQGLSPVTIHNYGVTAQRFLGRLGQPDCNLLDLTPVHLDQVLADYILEAGCGRATVCTYVAALRAFFGYAAGRKWCCKSLAASLQGPRLFGNETLPLGPSWEQVQQLLANTASDRPRDLRDRAIVLLLAIYGLRAAELVRLRLEHVDWERELLLVPRSKPGTVQSFPLTRTVGDAILRYLKEARPRSSHREIFLRLRAPFRPLATIWAVVGDRLRALGVSLPHLGPHALRHACATRLLAQGLSLKEIGDHLGHRSPQSTRVYAKVDLLALRSVGEVALEGLL
jgi:site-specific recombinase XerD